MVTKFTKLVLTLFVCFGWTAAESNQWKYKSEIDRITQEHRITIYTKERTTGEEIYLGVVCDRGDTRLSIQLPVRNAIASGNIVGISRRSGKLIVLDEYWLAKPYGMLELVDPERKIIELMNSGTDLLIEVATGKYRYIEFDITGFKQALEPVRAACKW